MANFKSLRAPDDFIVAGLAKPVAAGDLAAVTARYAVAMTPALAALVDRSDPRDPIALQFVPDIRELNVTPEEREDPIGDHAHSPVTGIVHRHRDRVLFKPVSVCPVYCRFCFRREMVGPDKDGVLSVSEMNAALGYIRDHDEIWEVILTGGDPLMMSPRRIAEITDAIGVISHVKVIRWHTRMPVADPQRLSDEVCAALASRHGKAVYVAAHVNHARELSEAARTAFARLAGHGIGLLSQSVLLAGVNDNLEALADLMRALVSAGVKPYYLHHTDLAPGTSHFRVSVARGQALMQALRDNVSGLCVPTYVIDIPGGVSKANAALPDVQVDEAGLSLRGRDGIWRDYAVD
ncbi:MAG: lysine 2,3-aminomutase [Hirschia sp.]|nr:lysine 2,3-aminomutase [Hirschia sp.]MBF18660.1 lysine 2,3-aminomutase [Hirschia sp.]